MKAYPLKSIDLPKAMEKQFKLVDEITHFFSGDEILSQGDLGVVGKYGQPLTTKKVEKVIASFFGAEDCKLVRGAGTGAIREGLLTFLKHGDTVLVHTSPIYETTRITLESIGVRVISADFNNIDILRTVILNNRIDGAIVQYTRQKLSDSYDFGEVIEIIKQSNIPVLTDDNYAVMKVDAIGVEKGSDLSAFSMFKLLGPEGIGCIVGKKKYIDIIKSRQYSGGTQVQGHEALAALRGLVYAPVSLAIQANVVEELQSYLEINKIEGIKHSFVANAQSKVVIVEFELPIAERVLDIAVKYGAAPHPIGAESKYEISPMFYRVSKTVTMSSENAEKYMIRINPMRSGVSTIVHILTEALKEVYDVLGQDNK